MRDVATPAEETAGGNGDAWTLADFLMSASAAVGVVLLWEVLVYWRDIPPVVLPAPSSVLRELWHLFASGIVFPHLEVTLIEILAGFALGSSAALVLGTLIALFRVVDRVVYPYLIAFQAVPKVALAPLLIIWFGFGIESKIFMTAIIAFFPVLVNTIVGLRSVEQDRLDLMTALRASRWKTFRYVRLPTALPFIFAGLDVASVLSVIGAIVGEFVGARAGLGYLLLSYNSNLRIAAVFAVLVILATIGILLHMAVLFAQRRVMFWTAPSTDRLVP
jgi:NitT/TauT family transport system permease protein